jgi:hypothetical protein
VKVIIPAAGLGTRFASMGLDIPKELLPLGGRPLIAHALDEAARAGFESAVVVVSPTKRQLRKFLADNKLPLPIEIVIQPQAMGIGDAVRRGWSGQPAGVLLPDDVVLETDHWRDLIALHRQDGAATLCVRPVPIETTSRFGIAECEHDRVVRLVEKPPPGTSTSNLAQNWSLALDLKIILPCVASTPSASSCGPPITTTTLGTNRDADVLVVPGGQVRQDDGRDGQRRQRCRDLGARPSGGNWGDGGRSRPYWLFQDLAIVDEHLGELSGRVELALDNAGQGL